MKRTSTAQSAPDSSLPSSSRHPPPRGLRNAILSGVLALASANALAAPTLLLSSPGLSDGATLSKSNATAANKCGGENISPALKWSGFPVTAKSFAVTIYDPEGAQGLGVVHWIDYNIPGSVTSLAAGAASHMPAGSTSGTNRTGAGGYYGPCPPAGDTPHHYVVQMYALDLAPGALAPGLTRDAFLETVRGHVLGSNGIVLRYGR